MKYLKSGISNVLTANNSLSIRDSFRALDKDRDGFINISEIQNIGFCWCQFIDSSPIFRRNLIFMEEVTM